MAEIEKILQWKKGKMHQWEAEDGAVAWECSPLQIMAWHLESEPVKCQTGYDKNDDRQIMTDLWPGSSERSQLIQPSER